MPRALTLRQHLRNAGRAGKGAAKRRSPEQYREIQAKARHARRVKAARKMLDKAKSVGAFAVQVKEQVLLAKWGEEVLRDALALEE
jgi:hypothetical protein